MLLRDEKIIWQYWETGAEKPRFIDGLYEIAKQNSGVKIILVTPETLGDYLPDIEDDVLRIAVLAHKADMIRSRLIMRYGGMWLDSDAIVLDDLNFLFEYLDEYEFIGFNNAGSLQSARPWVRVNCFLSRPNGRIIREWVRLQHLKLPKSTFEWSEIGAALLNPICLENRNSAKILPFERISPVLSKDVASFSVKDDARAEQILAECFIVMLSNQALRAKNARLRQLAVDEIAAEDHLLGRILRGALRPLDEGTPRAWSRR